MKKMFLFTCAALWVGASMAHASEAKTESAPMPMEPAPAVVEAEAAPPAPPAMPAMPAIHEMPAPEAPAAAMDVAEAAESMEEESSDEQPAGLALVVQGELDEAMAERVRSWVEERSGIRVDLLGPQPGIEGGLHEHAVAAAEAAGDGYQYVVALCDTVPDVGAHFVMAYENNAAAINVTILEPDDEDEETFSRRLEKLSLRSVGLLMDLKIVPNPFSCMFFYSTMEELDKMARDYDPPSLMALQNAAKEQGLAMAKKPMAAP